MPYAAVPPQRSRGHHRLVTDGKRRWTTHGVPVSQGESGSVRDFVHSEDGAEVRRHVAKRLHDRKPVAFDHWFLDDCRPAVSRQFGLSREGSSRSLCRRTVLIRCFNSSPEVIRLTVMMYTRYPLSLMQVEDCCSSAV